MHTGPRQSATFIQSAAYWRVFGGCTLSPFVLIKVPSVRFPRGLPACREAELPDFNFRVAVIRSRFLDRVSRDQIDLSPQGHLPDGASSRTDPIYAHLRDEDKCCFAKPAARDPPALSVQRRYDCNCYRPRVSDRDNEQHEHPGRYQIKGDLGPSKQHQADSDHKGVGGERKHMAKKL